ncbi:MAG: hypothetical protein IJ278_04970 [Clostridia bacterium]|nr:hypothetical protein [Clostridia bacterium]
MSKWLGMGLLILFVAFPQAVKSGISTGLEKGLSVLMPALFPYMVASQIFLKTGGASYLSRFIKVGRLSKKSVGILVPALFCGYPTGARLASLAYNNKEISKKELFILFSFGNVPGFGFCVSYLGGVLLGSFSIGMMIYASYLTASLILCTVFSRNKKEPETNCPTEESIRSFPSAITEAVTESSVSMVSLICFICFFSSLICLISSLPISQKLLACFSAFLEITSGLEQLLLHCNLPMVIFFTGFSGLCVLFQSLSFHKENAVNLLMLMASRCLYGIVAVFCFLLLRLLTV